MNKFDLTFNGNPVNRCKLGDKVYIMGNTQNSDIKKICIKDHNFHIGKEKIEIIGNSDLVCINDICSRKPSNDIFFYYE